MLLRFLLSFTHFWHPNSLSLHLSIFFFGLLLPLLPSTSARKIFLLTLFLHSLICPNHRRAITFPLSMKLLWSPHLLSWCIHSSLCFSLSFHTCSSNVTSLPYRSILYHFLQYSSFTNIQCCWCNYSFKHALFSLAWGECINSSHGPTRRELIVLLNIALFKFFSFRLCCFCCFHK